MSLQKFKRDYRESYTPTDEHWTPKLPSVFDYMDATLWGISEDGTFKFVQPSFTCLIKRRPVSWSRAVPMANRRGFYDKQKDVKAGYKLEWIAKGAKPIPPPVVMFIEFAYICTGRSEKARKRKLGTLKDSVPDLDNLIKFVKDAGKGVLFEDDRHVAAIHAAKIYRTYEGTTIWLYKPEDLRGDPDAAHRRSQSLRESEGQDPEVDTGETADFMPGYGRFRREL